MQQQSTGPTGTSSPMRPRLTRAGRQPSLPINLAVGDKREVKILSRIVTAVGILVVCFVSPAWADFKKGSRAYKSGDYATALKEWRPLAEQGHGDAQSNLGLMYERGQGVPQDYAKAISWYRLATLKGVAAAQYNLGLMYANGKGVPQDYAVAISWFRLAAAQGNAQAQWSLGAMYAKGRVVPQDYVQAHMWLNLAAAQGIKAAHDWRKRIEHEMTPAQTAEALKLAREWKPKK